MANVLGQRESWAEGQSAESGRPSLRTWIQRSWLELVGPRENEDVFASAGRAADNPRVLILAFIAALAVLAVISAIRDGGQLLPALLLLLAGLAMAFEIGCHFVEKRHLEALWLMLIRNGFYAMLVGAVIWVLIAVPHPVAYTRHPIGFLIYLLLICTAGLRDEPRLPIAAGAFSLLSYVLIAGFVPVVAERSEPAKAAALMRDFDGTMIIGHAVILFCTTLMGVATARRGQAIRRLSVRDGLTGLVNRRIFDACLAGEAERAKRHGRPLSIAMIDVDFFKSLNDTYGHAFGDEVLRWIAALLHESFRRNDLVARYGGEEFAVVFVDSDDDRLCERLDALRARIAATELRPKGTSETVHVSVSVGVARWPTEADRIEEALAVADRRLYLAKGAGRNRVVSAPFDAQDA